MASSCENGPNISCGHFIGFKTTICEGKNELLAGQMQQTFLLVCFFVSVGLERRIVGSVKATLRPDWLLLSCWDPIILDGSETMNDDITMWVPATHCSKNQLVFGQNKRLHRESNVVWQGTLKVTDHWSSYGGAVFYLFRKKKRVSNLGFSEKLPQFCVDLTFSLCLLPLHVLPDCLSDVENRSLWGPCHLLHHFFIFLLLKIVLYNSAVRFGMLSCCRIWSDKSNQIKSWI